MNTTGMKRFQSSEWNFALDVPKGWHPFPPVSSNSPLEVIRFASKEDGTHLVIIFRGPRDPKHPLKAVRDHAQRRLVRQGFRHFTTTETVIGSKTALVLEFDRPQNWHRWWRFWEMRRLRQPAGTWSCREYFLEEGSLQYILGFGTTDKERTFELYDRMAKSFEFSAE